MTVYDIVVIRASPGGLACALEAVDFGLSYTFCIGSQYRNLQCASDRRIVSVYRVPQMQCVGRADVLLYFKCPVKSRCGAL